MCAASVVCKDAGQLIRCLRLQGDGCGVWQHTACLGLSPNALPENFFCETCTAQRADPYWRVLESHRLMSPTRMLPSLQPSYPHGGLPPTGLQSIDRAFNLTSSHLELLRRSASHQLQVTQMHCLCSLLLAFLELQFGSMDCMGSRIPHTIAARSGAAQFLRGQSANAAWESARSHGRRTELCIWCRWHPCCSKTQSHSA